MALPDRDAIAAFLAAEFPQTRCTVLSVEPGGATVAHAVGHRHVVEALHLLGAVAQEAQRAAIGHGGRLAVDGLGHAEAGAAVAPKRAPVAGARLTARARGGAQHAEHGVVEGDGTVQVGGADHHVAEHGGDLLERGGGDGWPRASGRRHRGAARPRVDLKRGGAAQRSASSTKTMPKAPTDTVRPFTVV